MTPFGRGRRKNRLIRGVAVRSPLLDLALERWSGRLRARPLPVFELPGGQGVAVRFLRLAQSLLEPLELLVYDATRCSSSRDRSSNAATAAERLRRGLKRR